MAELSVMSYNDTRTMWSLMARTTKVALVDFGSALYNETRAIYGIHEVLLAIYSIIEVDMRSL